MPRDSSSPFPGKWPQPATNHWCWQLPAQPSFHFGDGICRDAAGSRRKKKKNKTKKFKPTTKPRKQTKRKETEINPPSALGTIWISSRGLAMGRGSLLRVSQVFPDDSANQLTSFTGLLPAGMGKRIWIVIRQRAGAVNLWMSSQLLQFWGQIPFPWTEGGGEGRGS